jgi:hypothetical protein
LVLSDNNNTADGTNRDVRHLFELLKGIPADVVRQAIDVYLVDESVRELRIGIDTVTHAGVVQRTGEMSITFKRANWLLMSDGRTRQMNIDNIRKNVKLLKIAGWDATDDATTEPDETDA